MSGVISLLKILYSRNKLLFVLVVIVLLVFVVGCSTQSNGYPPPSGPVGGGCG